MAAAGTDEVLKHIDPYQAVADTVRAGKDGEYGSAVVGALSLGLRPAKLAGPLAKEGVVVTEKGLALVEQNLAWRGKGSGLTLGHGLNCTGVPPRVR